VTGVRLVAILVSGGTAATPLLLASMGECVREKAGVIDIGIEGEMLAGAFAAFVAGRATGSPAAACAAAAAAAVLLGLLFAEVSLAGRADQIVTGTAVNLLALGATGFLLRSGFVPEAAGSALLPPVAGPLSALDVFALASVPLTWLFLFRTSTGLRLRSAGESIGDSEALGVPVAPIRALATYFGAAMAGLAGACLTLELSDTFLEGMSSGRGFLALALVAFGRWNPFGVAAAALVFGLLQAVQYQLQAQGLLQIPPQALLLLPYVFSLLALAGLAGRTRAPADLGKS
jgi:ABC-type uncharacterized transport system permease subunit